MNGIPIYADHKLPDEVIQDRPAAAAVSDIDGSWYALVLRWRLVVAELLARGINLHDAAVLDGPWLAVRSAIFDLLDSPTRLREILKRR